MLRFRDLGSWFSRFGCFVLRSSFSSASFSKLPRVRTFGCFLPKYATCGSTTYITWVRMDVLFDIRILKTTDNGKNRLHKRKLEIVTRSSYTWVKLMSEL